MSARGFINGWHHLAIQKARWSQGATGTPYGHVVVPGPNGNELLRDGDGRTVAVRPRRAGAL